MKPTSELVELFIPVLESHGIKVVECPACDFKNHIFTIDYVTRVVDLIKERATFVADFWTIASYLFISPSEFEAYGVKAGAAVAEKPADPRRAADPRAKVYDDAATAPFLAKDVDKFWKVDNYENAFEVCQFITGAEFGFDDLDIYRGPLDKAALEEALEGYIKMREYPMGKVMNCLRLALAGASSGLGIADIISLIGRKEFAARMGFAADRLGRGIPTPPPAQSLE